MEKAPEIRRRRPTADRVLDRLRSRPVARSARDLAKMLGLGRDTVSISLRGLQRRGLVEKVGTGIRTRYRVPGAAATSAPPVLLGDRPRTLGLRAAWLQQHGPLAEEA